MALFDHHEFANHERVIHVADEATGLRAIIAIHDRTLGPSVGGCRVYPYPTEDNALTDVLRLSKGMTYKTALAGLPFGGAKSVIIADPADKTPALIRAFGAAVDELKGQYWTGEDVNFGTADAEILASRTPYVLGRTKGQVNTGDPSPFTAGGVFAAMKGALRHVYGSEDLSGRRVAIQGVGHVGFHLAELVIDAGGEVVVTDVRPESSDRAAMLGASVVEPDAIYEAECDVFAPCAMGGTVNDETIQQLKAGIVCGAANNQLATPEAGQALLNRGIAYAPDYVANAGGILNAFGDFTGKHDLDGVWKKVNAIGGTVEAILARSRDEGRPASAIADEMAEAILTEARARHD